MNRVVGTKEHKGDLASCQKQYEDRGQPRGFSLPKVGNADRRLGSSSPPTGGSHKACPLGNSDEVLPFNATQFREITLQQLFEKLLCQCGDCNHLRIAGLNQHRIELRLEFRVSTLRCCTFALCKGPELLFIPCAATILGQN